MADNRNENGVGADYWDEPRYGGEPREEDIQMPPRSILETDSAKYTAEFVKGVVKGLYTSEPEAGESYAPAERAKPKRTLADEFADYESEPSFEPAPVFDQKPVKRVEREYEESVPEARQPEPRVSEPRYREPERPRHKEPDFEINEDEVLSADGFLKAYEEKNRGEKPAFTKKTARRTFSSLNSEEDSQSAESILSGRPRRAGRGMPSGGIMDIPGEEEEYVIIKQDTLPGKPRAYDYGAPERDARPAPAPEKEERAEYQAVDFEVEQKQERIPIIINKKIEGKPKKTADEYRNVTANRQEYDKPFKRFDAGRPVGMSAANIFSVVFMLAAIIIIAFLVWKVNSLSSGAGQYDPEEVAGLREQNAQLVKENSEWETKYDALIKENENLRNENLLLSAAQVEEEPVTEEGGEDEPAESTAPPQADGLTDGYYTVKSGDTLWKIAEQYLGNGDQYLRIANANDIDPAQPVFTGQKLKIPAR